MKALRIRLNKHLKEFNGIFQVHICLCEYKIVYRDKVDDCSFNTMADTLNKNGYINRAIRTQSFTQ